MIGITIHKIFITSILLSIFFLIGDIVFAQDTPVYKQHEIIEINGGLKIEILKCNNQKGIDFCDVIIYKQKRQLGKRKVIPSKFINQLRPTQTLDSTNVTTEVLITRKYIDSLFLAKDTTTKILRTSSIQISNIRKPEKDSITKPVQQMRTNPSVNSNQYNAAVLKKDSLIKKISAQSTIPPKYSTSVVTPIGYSLDQCYKIGLSQNIKLNQAKNTIELATIDNKTAKASLLPSISYDLGHYFSFGKNIDPVTNNFSFETFSGGYTSLNLQLILFAGFKKLNAIKQSSFLISAAEYNEKKNELELLTNITITYARMLLTNDELNFKRNSLINTNKELAIIAEKIKVGRLTRYEKYTFEGLLNTQTSELVGLQNDSIAALLNLKQLLNIPYSQNISLSPVDTALLNEIQLANFTLDEVGDKIIKNHPFVKLAQMNEQAAIVNEKIAKAASLPYLAISGNIVSNYNANQTENNEKISLSRQLNNNLGQNINISLRIPVFSQLQNSNRIRKEKINIKNAQMEVENAKNTILTNAVQLINDFNTAKQKYTATAAAFDQNKLSYELYYEKYKLGQISSVELLTAQDILNMATSKYLQARLQLFFQYKMLELLQKN